MKLFAIATFIVAVLTTSLLLTAVGSFTTAQTTTTVSTCAISDTITLATLAPMTHNVSLIGINGIKTNVAFAIGFCTAIQPSTAYLTTASACGSDGYVTVTNMTTGACIASWNSITSSLAYTSTYSSVSSVVQTSSTFDVFASSYANVTVTCNSSLSSTQVVASQNVTYVYADKTFYFHLQSGAACNATNFFCTADADCASAGKSCVNGVCFQSNCSKLTAITSPFAKTNSGVLGQFKVTDCTGTPLPNLTSNDFDVYLNGVSIQKSSQFNSEVDMYVSSTASAQPALTVLLMDMSASITAKAESLAAVKAAATSFVSLVQGQNAYHYIAIIAFDGSASPVVVTEHTTSTTLLNTGIDSMPPSSLTDPGSTNLFGAVKDAVAIANAMRFSFGPQNSSVSSTLIVFTDGYDTSARETQVNAVSAVLKQVDSVSVVGIGVASSSDALFLQSISTSGIFYFSTNLSTISSSFDQIANRLATSGQSVYSVGICEPLRSSNVTAIFTLNTSAFTTTQTQTVSFDASSFSGASCSNTTLASDLFLISLNSSTSNETDTLAIGTPIVETIVPQGAVFFSFTCDTTTQPVKISVTPVDTRIYLLNSTTNCARVSPYCYDATFLTSGVVEDCSITTYTGMILPPLTAGASSTVTVYATSLAGVTPSPPGSATTTTTSSPFSGSITTHFDLFNASAYTTSGEAHVDTAGAWIIFGFLIFTLFCIFLYNIHHWMTVVAPVEEQKEKKRRQREIEISPGAWQNKGVLERPLVIYASAQPYAYPSPGHHRQHYHGLSRAAQELSPVGRSKVKGGFVPIDA